MVVCQCDDLSVFEREFVVVLTAVEIGAAEAVSEFDALDCGYCEHELRDDVLQPVDHRGAHASRHSDCGAFNYSTDAVEIGAGCENYVAHLSLRAVADHREAAGFHRFKLFRSDVHRVKAVVLDVLYRENMRARGYSTVLQYLRADSPRENQRRSQSAGEVPSTARVVSAVVAQKSRVISVGRSCNVRDVAVVLGMLIAVEYNRRQRGAGGFTLVNAGKYIGNILFKAHRTCSVGFCGTARHVHSDLVGVYLLTCGEVVQNDSDALSVALAEY